MDKKNIYKNWLNKKIEVSDSFTDKVMKQVFEYERRPRWFDIQRVIEMVSAHAIFKNGFIAAGAILGVVRIIYIILIALS